MMKRIILFILTTGIYSFAVAQSWVLRTTTPLTGCDKASIDNHGHLYVSTKKGSIYKFDTTGNILFAYSPERPASISLLEASNTIKIFVYYRDYQEYSLLERFLGPMPNIPFNRDEIGFGRMATLASDYNLWVFDDTDFSLRKYDRQLNKVAFKTSLDLLLNPQEYDISFLREYQGNLYICDRNSGILIFDNFGSYKKKLPYTGLDCIYFRNDDLYFQQNDTLFFFNLYKLQTKWLAIPTTLPRYKRVVLYHNNVFCIREEGLDIYELK